MTEPTRPLWQIQNDLACEGDRPQMVRRYVRSTYEPDDYTYDIIWKDRLTGQTVFSYDGADPANTNPAYGGYSDAEAFERRGLDIHDEVELSRCVLPVAVSEVEACARQRAAREQREQEEAAARDLLSFLGPDADAFDFADWGKGESEMLRPALERRGFTGVGFYMGEQDSFGPLSRGCVATDPSGKRVRFYYG
ncbi:hypothetical protein [Brevundimonas sp. LjRoot202]|uniref:hypothetical protein n=1 Tax=Brevundimonas sp. LjRoot202 TaxID=3342281 RepID=UPI003ECE4132